MTDCSREGDTNGLVSCQFRTGQRDIRDKLDGLQVSFTSVAQATFTGQAVTLQDQIASEARIHATNTSEHAQVATMLQPSVGVERFSVGPFISSTAIMKRPNPTNATESRACRIIFPIALTTRQLARLDRARPEPGDMPPRDLLEALAQIPQDDPGNGTTSAPARRVPGRAGGPCQRRRQGRGAVLKPYLVPLDALRRSSAICHKTVGATPCQRSGRPPA